LSVVFTFHFSLFTFSAFAREGKPHHYADLLYTWSFDPSVVVSLAVSLIVYLAGIIRLWCAAGKGRGVGVKEISYFAGGWLAMRMCASSGFKLSKALC
jgi:hypothetical protein